ncbi:MAG: rod-binding protein [Alphaproteobacteria bacterium]
MGEIPLQDPSLIFDLHAQAPKVGAKGTAAEARKAAEDFEAFFLAQFIDRMFADLPTDGMFGGGQGEKVFRSLLSQEYGKVMARTGGVGIADSVYREILKHQEIE